MHVFVDAVFVQFAQLPAFVSLLGLNLYSICWYYPFLTTVYGLFKNHLKGAEQIEV